MAHRLGFNKIGHAGAKALMQGFQDHRSLVKLYLEGNVLSDEGAMEIASKLHKLLLQTLR